VDVVRELWFDPDGTRAAFGAGGLRVAEVQWTYVDLEKGTEEALDDLEGYLRAYGRGSSRWLFLADDYTQGEEVRIASLDLMSGEVRTHVTLEDALNFDFVGLTDDGRVGLVTAFVEEGTQIWLLVAEQDDAVLLAESRTATGSLSPDGEWVALSVGDEDDEETVTIKLVATDGGEEQVIGEGFMPVWAKP
jgi:hypothetical protein